MEGGGGGSKLDDHACSHLKKTKKTQSFQLFQLIPARSLVAVENQKKNVWRLEQTPKHFSGSLPHKITELTSLAGAQNFNALT